MKWKEIPKEDVPKHHTIQLATFHYAQEDVPVFLIPDESLSTETGQQGLRAIAKQEFDKHRMFMDNPMAWTAWKMAFDRCYTMFASQPQEGQDELWEEVVNGCQDFWLSKSMGRNELFIGLKSKFTLIKK